MQEKRSSGQRNSSTHEKGDGKAAFLATIDIFQHLEEAEISELERATTLIACQPGRVLFRPGETGNMLFFVYTGQVQLYHLSPDGRKLITATLTQGACFGELPLIGQARYTSFAEATEEARVYVIHKHEIEHLLQQKPTVALALLHMLAQRFAQMESLLIDTTFKGTTARLATLLLQLAMPQSPKQAIQAVDGLSQEELAARLGVYRETVSTSLRDLRDAGAIELGRKHITITNASVLEDMAQS